MFLIDKESWNSEDIREQFINQIIFLFQTIKQYDFLKVNWTDNMESIIWQYVELTPWIKHSLYRNMLMEPFYRFLVNEVIRYEDKDNRCGYFSANVEFFNEQIKQIFINLVHTGFNDDKSMLVFPYYGRAKADDELNFICSSHGDLQFKTITDSDKWISNLDLSTDYFWPMFYDDVNVAHFKTAIILGISINHGYLVYKDFDFSSDFITAITNEVTNRDRILKALSLRLSMNQKAASQNKSLHDEPIRVNDKLRRFRVDQKCRIHYEYDDLGSIIFHEYDDSHRKL